MISFIPYRPEHLGRIEVQPTQERWRGLFTKPGYAEALDVENMAWTALDDAGRVLGCAGFAPQWEGRVIGWAVFGCQIPRTAWYRIIKKIEHEIKTCLASHGRHRLEITVPYGFGAGCRLAHLLGFKVEGVMKEYGPDGSDQFLYARIVSCA